MYKCPVCKNKMMIERKETSYDLRRNNKEYKRVVYWCKKDDVWLSTEVPKEKENGKA